MQIQPCPKDGDRVMVQGFEFIATDVRIVHDVNGQPGRAAVRFKGVCTAAACNDFIRNTGYNGGTYGWFLADGEAR